MPQFEMHARADTDCKWELLTRRVELQISRKDLTGHIHPFVRLPWRFWRLIGQTTTYTMDHHAQRPGRERSLPAINTYRVLNNGSSSQPCLIHATCP